MSHPEPSPSRSGDVPERDADGLPVGKLDAVSVLYVLGGIPAMVGFFVLLFGVGVRFCGLPA